MTPARRCANCLTVLPTDYKPALCIADRLLTLLPGHPVLCAGCRACKTCEALETRQARIEGRQNG